MSDETYTVYGGKRGGGEILELGKLLAFKNNQLSEAQNEIERWQSAALYYAEKCGSMPKWIPVSERLPEENTLCLYFTPYDGDREWDMGVVCFRNEFIFVSNTGGATHWMPLPEPPKEGE